MPPRVVNPYPLPGFGQQLRDARITLGITQTELARRLDVKKLVVSLWEREKSFPLDKNFLALCKELGIEPTTVNRPERNAKGRKSIRRAICANPDCGIDFPVFYGEKFCSRACAYSALSGGTSYNWKGGRTVDVKGYVHIYRPEHPHANHGYVREHVLVMEEKLGRYLERHERVHHKDGNRSNNNPDNLELWKVKAKDPSGVRAADYHCPGCRCFEHSKT